MLNESYKFLYESVKNKFDFISNADNAFDTKIGVLIATIIGVLAIYFAVIDFQEMENLKFKQSVVALSLIFSSLAILIWIQFPKKYTTIIGSREIIDRYINKSEAELLLQLISDTQYAFTENKKILDKKVRYYTYSVYILLFALLLLLLSVLPGIIITI